MQRILRINVHSRNQVLRATRKKNRETYLQDWKEYSRRNSRNTQLRNEYIRAEKKARREDWILGPLAPKRDVGTKKDFYGTVDPLLYLGPVFPPRLQKGPKSVGWSPVGMEGRIEEQIEWEGTGNEGNIVVGDRVVIIRGKPGLVGQIGKVRELGADTKDVRIEGLNLADIEIPENFPEHRKSTHFMVQELPVPLSDVRLVYRHTDPSTGKDRDVVVKLLRGGGPYVEREPNSPLPRHTRYIAGEDIEIPWPEVEVPLYDAFQGDTTRYDVEAITYTPTLYDPPVPPAAFDDLFSKEKFQRDRRWHDEEYLRMKVLEDARANWYMERKMQSPRARLGEDIRRRSSERAEALKKAGMSEETRRIIEMQMTQSLGEKTAKTAKVMA